ncbi:MAG: hypothetical protein ACRCYY_03315 [Trueperaceae bacterium]
MYQKQADGTWRYEVLENEGVLSIPCIGLEMSLEDIYENVDFNPES